MVRRILPALALASLVAVIAAACDPNAGDGYYYDRPASFCAQYSSCAACTPVQGCGWCFNADGTGTCAPGPDACRTQEFSWTWDLAGCRGGQTDAAVSAHDGAAGHDASDASNANDASDATDGNVFHPGDASAD